MTNKRWFILLAVAMVIFIIANAINMLFINRVPSIPATSFSSTNVDNSNSNFSQVSFSGTTPDFPQSLPIATTQKFTTSEQDIVTIIINEFNLTPHSKVSDLWTSNEWALSKSNDSLFTLVRNQYQAIDQSQMNPEITRSTAQNFIDSYFKQLNLQQLGSATQYYTDILEPEESEPSVAELAKVPFSYTISGYPVFYEQNSIHPFVVWISAKQEIIKFSYYPQFIQLQEIGSKPLISIDQAIENINTLNLGSVVNYENTSTTIVSLDQVEQADMNFVEVEYRVDPTTNLAFPFYRFSGTAFLSGIQTPIEITTPAVVVE